MEILSLENLTFTYPKTEDPAVENVSLQVDEGDFVLLCGASGCGKTTLLKLLKRELTPSGEQSGTVKFRGRPLSSLTDREAASDIGFVMQNPDEQIVTDKVWHELAYGLENLGVPSETIRLRVGETASWFGISDSFRKSADELSGGQKQLLNLAAVSVMNPSLLLLDEPTGQLDPIAAAEFISILKKLNRELGLTVIIAEHRLEDIFPVADKVAVMENGKIIVCDSPRAVGRRLAEVNKNHPMLAALPSAVRIYSALEGFSQTCPLTVREGRAFLEKNFASSPNAPLPSGESDPPVSEKTEKTAAGEPEATSAEKTETPAVELKNVWFRYERDLPDVLRSTNLKAYFGEVFCLLGDNGVGKTTSLNVIAGLDRAYRGKTLINGTPITKFKGGSLYRKNVALLPQDPQTVFVRDEVQKDLEELAEACGLSKTEREKRISELAEKLGITPFLKKHPLDLSGGEQQKCALAKTLLSEPKILLLDEPTKGLDAFSKNSLSSLLRSLKNDGLCILIVTHDVEFAAENADRCALFFDGEILACDIPSRFFSENNFYTTAANRMARRLWKDAVTCESVVARCRSALANGD